MYSFLCIKVRNFFVVSLFGIIIASSLHANQTNTKVADNISPPPITQGWEYKNTISNPIRKGWDTIQISSSLQKIKTQLTKSDYMAALQAMQHALTEVGDGKIYVWHSHKLLHGRIQPTNVFKDADSRLCRHVVYTLFVNEYSQTVEGVACRSLNGRWDLAG
ncbi:MAG: hypothetical protein AAF228_05175 [Pseudomonadota bacterium]